MRHITSFGLTAIIAFFLTSCKKDVADINATILGKWNVLNDSIFEGVGISNHPANYTGKTGDYFDFRNDGKLYIKEGLKLDTSTYQLTSDTTILIPAFGITLNGVTEASHITNLTTHYAAVTAPTVATPGGLFGRKVDLSR
ncbi:MAG: hypothetical protein ACRYFB_02795 [Janthinobacterium lividum]